MFQIYTFDWIHMLKLKKFEFTIEYRSNMIMKI